MTRVRTKRKSSKQKFNSIIISIFIVFISIYALMALGDFLKSKTESWHLDIKNNKSFQIRKIKEIDSLKFYSQEENINSDIAIIELGGENLNKLNTITLTTSKGDKIIAELADTDEKRTLGLSGREKLVSEKIEGINIEEGMLFVFPEEVYTGFWMKDMNFDLDIIWLSENFEILQIEKALASSYNKENPDDSEIFSNTLWTAKYVLEINFDATELLNLKVGDKLSIY